MILDDLFGPRDAVPLDPPKNIMGESLIKKKEGDLNEVYVDAPTDAEKRRVAFPSVSDNRDTKSNSIGGHSKEDRIFRNILRDYTSPPVANTPSGNGLAEILDGEGNVLDIGRVQEATSPLIRALGPDISQISRFGIDPTGDARGREIREILREALRRA